MPSAPRVFASKKAQQQKEGRPDRLTAVIKKTPETCLSISNLPRLCLRADILELFSGERLMSLHAAWSLQRDGVGISPTTAGMRIKWCPQHAAMALSGYFFAFRTIQKISPLSAAYGVTDADIRVSYDDTLRANGWCVMQRPGQPSRALGSGSEPLGINGCGSLGNCCLHQKGPRVVCGRLSVHHAGTSSSLHRRLPRSPTMLSSMRRSVRRREPVKRGALVASCGRRAYQQSASESAARYLTAAVLHCGGVTAQ